MRNLYEVNHEMIMPACQEDHVSYVELLRRRASCSAELQGSAVQTFVSHWWGEQFPKLLQTLAMFAETRCAPLPWRACTSNKQAPFTWSFWICAFCNNQYAVEHAVCSDVEAGTSSLEAVMSSAFATALMSDTVQDVLAVLDRDAKIYSRIWCCFELFFAVKVLPERRGKELEVFIGNELGVISSGCGPLQCFGCRGKLDDLAALISNVKTEEADASSQQDKDMILQAMREAGTTNKELDGVLRDLAQGGLTAAWHKSVINMVTRTLLLVFVWIALLNLLSDGRAADDSWWTVVILCAYIFSMLYFFFTLFSCTICNDTGCGGILSAFTWCCSESRRGRRVFKNLCEFYLIWLVVIVIVPGTIGACYHAASGRAWGEISMVPPALTLVVSQAVIVLMPRATQKFYDSMFL